MRSFLPPESTSLFARIAARNSRRARRVAAALRGRTPSEREALRALRAALATLRGEARRDLMLSPEMRAWLPAAEEALALARPPSRDRDLFEIAARGPHLGTLLPTGRWDGRTRARAVALGGALLARALARLPAVLMFRTPAGERFGPCAIELAADGEEARLAGELHLSRPVPATLRLPASARIVMNGEGVSLLRAERGTLLMPRALIEGSRIAVARRVVSTRRGLRPGRRVAGIEARLSVALRLLRSAWPEGYREVLAHTRVVVPLIESGTVSYSLPDRPGISYINTAGKSVIDLADDLLHEAAHHRLHGLEELAPLVREDGEPRYRSPWRRSLRPLRGILHATYTFAYRAELLSRLSAHPGKLPRSWLRRELSMERRALARSLADLADAGRRGLLTPAGQRVRRAIAYRSNRVRDAPPQAWAGGEPGRVDPLPRAGAARRAVRVGSLAGG